ncbi:hypothetical protein [Limnobacter sp.]|uniref:hypothetical protein n=1 Tax=Limnobacter sp. TaxID=2003368 RepID=UPI0035167C87
MIDSLASLTSTTAIKPVASTAISAADVSQFKELLGGGNQALGTIQQFIDGAENRLVRGELAVSSKLKDFDYKDNVMGLVHAMHQSSMNSVSVQLTGKVGTKVSESFESLIKQQ